MASEDNTGRKNEGPKLISKSGRKVPGIFLYFLPNYIQLGTGLAATVLALTAVLADINPLTLAE